MMNDDTIIALSTAAGAGAIAVIRLSGEAAIEKVGEVFQAKSKQPLLGQKSHTLHYGDLVVGQQLLDEVVIGLFRNPHSYTGEDVVEISCHGSRYIQEKIIHYFVGQGIRPAQPGEFTLRAFLNGKMDLAQAEAVADVIAAENAASHQIALQQMRGGFSNDIKQLRQELLNFASLIELELDFAEEDVAFADRESLRLLLEKITATLKQLIDSFALGNVIKRGIPITIVGPPNAGKSTLLNALLKEDKAIISNIAGTTRDSIEDEMTIDGMGFRFIDTAGIRATDDTIEQMGIEKTFEKARLASVVLYLIDASTWAQEKATHLDQLNALRSQQEDKPLWVIFNKVDLAPSSKALTIDGFRCLALSAKTQEDLETLKQQLVEHFRQQQFKDESMVTNHRHYAALANALEEVGKVQWGMNNEVSSDLLAIDLRQALYHLGEVTGEVSNDELLGNIFANFCIGK